MGDVPRLRPADAVGFVSVKATKPISLRDDWYREHRKICRHAASYEREREYSPHSGKVRLPPLTYFFLMEQHCQWNLFL